MDFTVPIDKYGLVIYFSVSGKKYLFNGHTGSFYDALPRYAQEAFEATHLSKHQKTEIFKALRKKFGSPANALIKDINLFQRGTHPDLRSESPQSSFFQRKSPHAFNVFISRACNMACCYCVNQGGTFGGKRSLMSINTAKNCLTFITKIVQSEIHDFVSVNLFGGEPLLNPEAAYILARGLQDLNHSDIKTKIHLILSTNGTIYNKKLFDVFAERPDLSTVVVSLDAYRDVHDSNRPFANKKKGSSYDFVAKNLTKMIDQHIPHSATCVVAYPYNYIGAAEELHKIGVECLEIKPILPYIFGKTNLPEAFRSEFNSWRKSYIDYADYYLDYLNKKNPIKHVDRYNMLHEYARKLNNKDRLLACGVADIKIAVDSDGTLAPCEGFISPQTFRIGDVYKGFNRQRYEDFEQWILKKGQHRVYDEQCRFCFAKLLCGGGCYARQYDVSKDINPLYEPPCSFVRETVKIDLYYISEMKFRQPKIFSRLTGVNLQEIC